MSFIQNQISEGRTFFNPVTEDFSLTKVSLVNGSSFGQIASADAYLIKAGNTLPNAGKFEDGGAGYKLVTDGNLLGLSAFKKPFIVQSVVYKNLSSGAIRRINLVGAMDTPTLPFTLMPGEDLRLEGTATDADNYVGIFLKSPNPEGL